MSDDKCQAANFCQIDGCQFQRLTAELQAAREALEMALIGGNHIACVLIGKIGPGFASLYPPDMPHAEVLELLGAGDEYETWCCWRALMNARANARVLHH